MRKIPTLSFLAGLFLMLFLNGCAAIGLAHLGVGASVATGTAISYILDGIAYRTFTTPLHQLRTTTLTALDRMGIKVKTKEKTDRGESIKASGADRQIEVELEAISPKSTRMRTVAKQGVFFVIAPLP